MRDILPSFLIAIGVIVIIAMWELAPPESGTVIAVLGPNTSLKQTVHETDAYLVRESRLPNAYVLYSRAPDFPARLRRAGAILVLDSAYAGACTSSSQEPTRTPISARSSSI
jgi:hypothetical protein